MAAASAARTRPVVIGARGSSLSLCQTRMVQAELEARHGGVGFEIKTIAAKADRDPEVPLIALGGEGVFVKELEQALSDRRIDLAVHSLKDLPLAIPEGLTLAAVTERDDPRDCLISRTGASFDALPRGATVGTSSLRRRSQLAFQRPDLVFAEIRGNVDTRLRKLDDGLYDAIVLAACGLIRLGLDDRITHYFSVEQLVPEPGQGALALETRAGTDPARELAKVLDHQPTRTCVNAERAFLQALGGGCRVPIAAYAERDGDHLHLTGVVADADGRKRIAGDLDGPATSPESLGQTLAAQLIDQGAKKLLQTRP